MENYPEHSVKRELTNIIANERYFARAVGNFSPDGFP
jgi:hypothetical protein